MKYIRHVLFAYATLALSSAAFQSAVAQSTSAKITVSASIPQTVAVTGGQDVSFGSILPGVTESIETTDSRSGRIKISGQPGSEIFFSFTLPTTLTSGSDTLTVAFDKTSAAVAESANLASFVARGDPRTGFAARLGTGNNGIPGELYLALGCTVAPRPDQLSGVYSGEIHVTIVYTGN